MLYTYSKLYLDQQIGQKVRSVIAPSPIKLTVNFFTSTLFAITRCTEFSPKPAKPYVSILPRRPFFLKVNAWPSPCIFINPMSEIRTGSSNLNVMSPPSDLGLASEIAGSWMINTSGKHQTRMVKNCEALS